MKYIFIDIDGTILSHSQGIIPSTVEGLRKLKERGHKIFLSTGRSLAEISKDFESFKFDGYICAAGSYVFVDNKAIYKEFIPEDLVLKLIDKFKKTDIKFGLEGETKVYFGEFEYQKYLDIIKSMYELKGNNRYSAYDFYIPKDCIVKLDNYLEEKTNISKLILYRMNTEVYKVVESFLDERVELIKYENYAELVLKGNNKFTGIQKLLDYYDIPISESVAIGDSMNDLEMIRDCGLGIAMGNSSDPVKAVADYVTDTLSNDGFYKALEKFNLI